MLFTVYRSVTLGVTGGSTVQFTVTLIDGSAEADITEDFFCSAGADVTDDFLFSRS